MIARPAARCGNTRQLAGYFHKAFERWESTKKALHHQMFSSLKCTALEMLELLASH